MIKPLKMNRLYIYLTITLFCLIKMNAQSIITTSGGDITSSNGSISFTIGQLAYETYFGSTGSIIQGIQISIVPIILGDGHKPEILETIFFPNPTKEFINIKIPQFQGGNYKYEIVDMIGRSLGKSKITRELTTIDIRNFQSGMYMLIIDNQINVKTTFKIIKQ